ncbi:MAG: hypothetical protein COC00_002030 [Rhizobiales bacterium]|nr:hypothetical protein [Hyphomicrobiales bacterium]
MKRLLENELIFGNLLTVDEPHLIERYNKALKGFGLKAITLEQFSIDMTGYSPEVAHDLGNPEYLDPDGVNRRFIILTPDQEFLPVVHTQFSNTEELMLNFFDKNKREIFALTIKDVLYGEIEDSVLKVEDIDDLLAIEEVEFQLQTPSNILGKRIDLQLMIDKLQKDPEAWRDDAMLKKMVTLAKVTGDVRTNELLPHELVFRHDAFWTSHFGGVYVFNDKDQITVIADPSAKGFRKSRPWEVAYIDINDHARVFDFLLKTRRVEAPRQIWIKRSGLLERRARMIILKMMLSQEPDLELGQMSARKIDSWAKQNSRLIKSHDALQILKRADKLGDNFWGKRSEFDLDDISPEHRFMVSRANPDHADLWLTNRLMSEYMPFDFLTLFVFNKQGFYKRYADWPENYREFVVNSIRDTYFSDKSGLRAQLYN